MATTDFLLAQALRVPGLGLLVLPAGPGPAWLGTHPLHTAVQLRLHRPGQLPLPLPATIEEITPADQPARRGLLLDADPAGYAEAGAWLEFVAAAPDSLH